MGARVVCGGCGWRYLVPRVICPSLRPHVYSALDEREPRSEKLSCQSRTSTRTSTSLMLPMLGGMTPRLFVTLSDYPVFLANRQRGVSRFDLFPLVIPVSTEQGFLSPVRSSWARLLAHICRSLSDFAPLDPFKQESRHNLTQLLKALE